MTEPPSVQVYIQYITQFLIIGNNMKVKNYLV